MVSDAYNHHADEFNATCICMKLKRRCTHYQHISVLIFVGLRALEYNIAARDIEEGISVHGSPISVISFDLDHKKVKLSHAGTWLVEFRPPGPGGPSFTLEVIIVTGCVDRRAISIDSGPMPNPLGFTVEDCEFLGK